MRGDFKNRKCFKSIKISYKVIGLNQDRLILELKRRDIALYDIKKISNREMQISVNLNQSDNFFAITENLCYNVEKLRLYGKATPIFSLIKNLGLALGALALIFICIFANDFIFGINFSGSGSIYKRQVLEYLSSRGITEMTRFSAFETARLEDEILSENPNLTFVSLEKKGNILSVYLTLKKQNSQTVSGTAQELRAISSGVIESVKVYKGTALVGVGDSVEAGELLVDGYAVIKEQVVQTGVLAYITMLENKSFNYLLYGLEKESEALAFAEQELKDREIINSTVTVKPVNGEQYAYTVSLEYRRVLYAG